MVTTETAKSGTPTDGEEQGEMATATTTNGDTEADVTCSSHVQQLVIAPQVVGDLTHVSASHETLSGTVTVEWRVEGINSPSTCRCPSTARRRCTSRAKRSTRSSKAEATRSKRNCNDETGYDTTTTIIGSHRRVDMFTGEPVSQASREGIDEPFSPTDRKGIGKPHNATKRQGVNNPASATNAP